VTQCQIAFVSGGHAGFLGCRPEFETPAVSETGSGSERTRRIARRGQPRFREIDNFLGADGLEILDVYPAIRTDVYGGPERMSCFGTVRLMMCRLLQQVAKTENMTPYESSFYQTQSKGSSSSAGKVVPYLMSLLKPRSVVDVGCGTGTWLAEFTQQGVTTVLGIDGAYVDKSLLRISANTFLDRDLEVPLELEQTFDLAISMEVAEHLSPGRASSFVRDLTRLAPLVVFSAAIPFQGGTNHLNEQWTTYWNAFFAAQGFRAIDCLRARFWNDTSVEFWYRQNIMLYVSNRIPRTQDFVPCDQLMPLDVVHPELFCASVTQPTLRYLLKSFPSALARSFKSHIGINSSKCDEQ
jgi:SAM-dependent methyltransferase